MTIMQCLEQRDIESIHQQRGLFYEYCIRLYKHNQSNH